MVTKTPVIRGLPTMGVSVSIVGTPFRLGGTSLGVINQSELKITEAES